jgi:hypothetical protein
MAPKNNKSNSSSSLAETKNDRSERREKREKTLQHDEANERNRQLEEAVANMTLNDPGTKFYQDRWEQAGCSKVVVFPTTTSCTMASADDGKNHSYNSMPGVHGQLAMVNGCYLQLMLLKGDGYTAVGLVGQDKKNT